MLSKLSLSTFLSAATLTGAVLISSITPGFSCPFSNRISPSDSITTSSNPSDFTDNANFNKSELNKLGIVGGSLAALLGLYAGGMALKSRLTKRNESDLAEVPYSNQTEAYKELSTFPIIVPAEALVPSTEDEAIDLETTSNR